MKYKLPICLFAASAFLIVSFGALNANSKETQNSINTVYGDASVLEGIDLYAQSLENNTFTHNLFEYEQIMHLGNVVKADTKFTTHYYQKSEKEYIFTNVLELSPKSVSGYYGHKLEKAEEEKNITQISCYLTFWMEPLSYYRFNSDFFGTRLERDVSINLATEDAKNSLLVKVPLDTGLDDMKGIAVSDNYIVLNDRVYFCINNTGVDRLTHSPEKDEKKIIEYLGTSGIMSYEKEAEYDVPLTSQDKLIMHYPIEINDTLHRVVNNLSLMEDEQTMALAVWEENQLNIHFYDAKAEKLINIAQALRIPEGAVIQETKLFDRDNTILVLGTYSNTEQEDTISFAAVYKMDEKMELTQLLYYESKSELLENMLDEDDRIIPGKDFLQPYDILYQDNKLFMVYAYFEPSCQYIWETPRILVLSDNKIEFYGLLNGSVEEDKRMVPYNTDYDFEHQRNYYKLRFLKHSS